eukprot:717757-Amphidinium_carterae.2
MQVHGNGQADLLANQGAEAQGPLALDVTWTNWAIMRRTCNVSNVDNKLVGSKGSTSSLTSCAKTTANSKRRKKS